MGSVCDDASSVFWSVYASRLDLPPRPIGERYRSANLLLCICTYLHALCDPPITLIVDGSRERSNLPGGSIAAVFHSYCRSPSQNLVERVVCAVCHTGLFCFVLPAACLAAVRGQQMSLSVKGSLRTRGTHKLLDSPIR